MDTLTLLNLTLENFKGLRRFEVSLDGQNARIHAENGIGKTTLYDGWLWPLFGKDSTWRKDFEVRPLDEHNHAIKGLVVMSEATIAANGQTHTLRKEQHEKVVKDQFKGYETLCWVNEVPMTVGKYQAFIDSLIPEETFKMLADLSYFNSKLHHTERRRTLLTFAGTVAKPQGFESLLVSVNGRSYNDYGKVLHDRKVRHTKERDEINPRIDEIRRAMNGYAEQETSKLQVKRQNITQTFQSLNSDRNILLGQEKDRQARMEAENHLTVQRLHRESIVRAEQDPTQPLRDEKARINDELAAKEEGINALHRQIKSIEASIETAQHELNQVQQNLERTRGEIDAIDKVNIASVCYACGQKLPKAKLEDNKAEQQAKHDQLEEAANRLKETVEHRSAEIDGFQLQKRQLSTKAAELYKQFQAACDAGRKRVAEIDAAILNRPEPDMTQDAEWCKLTEQIEKAKAEIGAPVTEQLDAIESRKNEAQRELDKVNTALAQADRAKADKTRIAELEAKEKDLAQKIADIDRELAEIDQYKAAESRLIEEAVNSRFTHVQFKLFNYNLNGSIEDTCEAMLNGVPYMDMSTGQQILAGVDVINALSEHYGISVPLWIDHAESLTLPLEARSQVIELYAEKGMSELTIEVAEKVVAA